MMEIAESFESNGYAIVDAVLSDGEISEIARNLGEVTVGKAGTRNLLFFDWCAQLAQSLRQNPLLAPLLPELTAAVQCTYFPKSSDRNWLVALHRDHSIPVKRPFDARGWHGWSKKEGIHYVRPPGSVLKALVAVRLHLEDNTEQNAPLAVVPGSHENHAASGVRVNCLVPRGGVLIMRPLLLHASSKLAEGSRRVLHFLYGPRTLPDNAEWANAV